MVVISKAKSNLFDSDANQTQISRIIQKFQYQQTIKKKMHQYNFEKVPSVPAQKKYRVTAHVWQLHILKRDFFLFGGEVHLLTYDKNPT